MTALTSLVLVFGAVSLMSWLAVAGIRSLAIRWNVVDVPNERSSHLLPMPLCGGLALVIVNVAAWAYYGLTGSTVSGLHAVVFLVGALLISCVSFIDDLGHVPYRVRLGIQASAALIFIIGYGSLQVVSLPVVGAFSLGAVGIVLTFVWIIGLTNAYNFMDGIDGMAGGQAVAAGLGWVVLGLLTGHPLLVGVGSLLSASSLGFLVHNWHPARIFMGDVGATFLGYSFPAITVIASHSDPKLAVAGVLLVWPSIFDTGFTVIRRLQRRENVFAGHRSFLFHRLVGAGWSHGAAALLYIPLPVLGAVLACTWERGSRPLHEAAVLVLALACFGLWSVIHRQERGTVAAGTVVPITLEWDSVVDGIERVRAEPVLIGER